MSDDTETTTEELQDETEQQQTETEPVEGEDSLADAGKKALDTMKQQRNAARQSERELKTQLAELQAQIAAQGKSAEEQQLDQARREAQTEANRKANERILRSELKGAAKGKLADPADVFAFVDLSKFEVDDNGEVDADAVNDAIDDLLSRKPHLGVPDTRRFQGDADQGPAGRPKVKQLTRDQLSTMTPDQINKAREGGQLDHLLGVTS